jgi:hypothetical protein
LQFGDVYVEAPMMFKRGGLYYTAFGRCCCYCESGSIVSAYMATKPLGPYTKVGSLGQLHSQSTDIFPYVDDAGDVQFMYLGDHWQSAPDQRRGHDFSVWAKLIFARNGSVTTAGFEENFTASVRVAGQR